MPAPSPGARSRTAPRRRSSSTCSSPTTSGCAGSSTRWWQPAGAVQRRRNLGHDRERGGRAGPGTTAVPGRRTDPTSGPEALERPPTHGGRRQGAAQVPRRLGMFTAALGARISQGPHRTLTAVRSLHGQAPQLPSTGTARPTYSVWTVRVPAVGDGTRGVTGTGTSGAVPPGPQEDRSGCEAREAALRRRPGTRARTIPMMYQGVDTGAPVHMV